MSSGEYNFNRQTSVCYAPKKNGRCPPGKHSWQDNPAKTLKSIAAFKQAYSDPSATISYRLRVAYLDRLIESSKKKDAAYQKAYEQQLYDKAFHIETFTFDMQADAYQAVGGVPKFKDYKGWGFDPVVIAQQAYEQPVDPDPESTKNSPEQAIFANFLKVIKEDPAKYVVDIDKYDHDDVRPKLKCASPCYSCWDTDPERCTSCWGAGKDNDNKRLFLQYRAPRDPDPERGDLGTREAWTCAEKCDPGSTIDGRAIGVTLTKASDPLKPDTRVEAEFTDQTPQATKDKMSKELSYYRCQSCD
jgi:hypothetical protein